MGATRGRGYDRFVAVGLTEAGSASTWARRRHALRGGDRRVRAAVLARLRGPPSLGATRVLRARIHWAPRPARQPWADERAPRRVPLPCVARGSTATHPWGLHRPLARQHACAARRPRPSRWGTRMGGSPPTPADGTRGCAGGDPRMAQPGPSARCPFLVDAPHAHTSLLRARHGPCDRGGSRRASRGARAARTHAPPGAASARRRAGRVLRHRAHLSYQGGHRSPAVSREQLWAVLEGASADGETRTAAARALAVTLTDEDRPRMRAIATRVTDPRLRVALDALVEEEEEEMPPVRAPARPRAVTPG